MKSTKTMKLFNLIKVIFSRLEKLKLAYLYLYVYVLSITFLIFGTQSFASDDARDTGKFSGSEKMVFFSGAAAVA